MKSIALCLGLFLSLAAHAESQNESVTVLKPVPNAVYEDSSEYNRMDKSVSVTLQPFGAGPISSLSQGVDLGFFLSRNTLLVLEGATNSQFKFNSTSDINSNALGLHLKHFFGNSFYTDLGVDYRRTDYNYSNNSSTVFTSSTSKESFLGESLAGELTIGNQWQWSNFTLGCDWIGVVVPFASRIQNEVATNVSSAALQADEDSYVRGINLEALKFYLGLSF